MQSTRNIVIGALLIVGIGSFAYQICTDDTVTLGSTLLILGTECLKTAVFFILLDNLIARSEKRNSEYIGAREALLVGSWSTAEEVNSLFDKVSRSNRISVPLGRTAKFSGTSLELKERKFVDASWVGADFGSVSIDRCEFESIQFSKVSFSRCVFSDCVFNGCGFDGIDLNDTVFIRCKFKNLRALDNIGIPTFTDCSGHEALEQSGKA